ncbi:hypothetical protein HGRIS_010210 [Hohenbuehelia grisea]|uniref:tripeptidyl-peptidase II n=1 Tax=Hohenbuehelia grisea TaxID=104357 RepID=A0ABR3J3M1_9AGAR
MRSSFYAAGFLLAFGQAVMAAPTVMNCAHKLKHSIDEPRGWIKFAPAPASHKITLRVALPQPRISELEQHLLQVSDPDHPRYGNYLSKAEVDVLSAPHPESIKLVKEWFAGHGLSHSDIDHTSAQDWATVTVPIRTAEKMLKTRYHIWKHAETGELVVRTTRYSLPELLHDHIALVQPTTIFSRWSELKSSMFYENNGQVEKSLASSANRFYSLDDLQDDGDNEDDEERIIAPHSDCTRTVTIDCLMRLYNAAGYRPNPRIDNSIGVTGFLENYANIEDMKTMFQHLHPAAARSAKFDFVSVNKGENHQQRHLAGAEANLDIQYALGMVHPIKKAVFYSTGGRPPFNASRNTVRNTNEPYLEWVNHVLTEEKPPLVITTSYGEDEQTVPREYAELVCRKFMQLTARGVTLVFSSGDGGVGDGKRGQNHKCYSNDGKDTYKFLPLFPSGCPYVTSVGATYSIPEVAASFSGGGFSEYFTRPAYQEKTVSNYLKTLPEGLYKGLYNPAGRATPDISAQGRFFQIHHRGRWGSIGGTSASAPAVAAIFALLNDALLSKGKGPLGFINPFLYSKGFEALNDVVYGSNPGCGTEGFNATVGWDPGTFYVHL